MGKAASIRINETLYSAADRAGHIQKRSIAKQVELWAELGKAVEHIIKIEDVFAVIQGLKKIEVTPIVSKRVESKSVIKSLEKSRKDGALKGMVTKAPVYFEGSKSSPGLIDRVVTKTGERQTGRFEGGKFIPA
jgi:hypothetical protein